MDLPASASDRPGTRTNWLLAVGLVALSLIPLTAGGLRIVQLAGGPAVLPPDDRWTVSPFPVVVHIVSAAVFALAGAFQFVPSLRAKHPAWHRRVGRVVALAGLVVAVSALWLTLFYEPQAGTGDLLYLFRLVAGSAMVACIVLGVSAVRQHRIVDHRAWMMRAYAIGLAAGTQVFTEGITEAAVGPGTLSGDLAKGSAWIINLVIAEWFIRRGRRRRRSRSGHATPTPAAGAFS